MTSHLSVTIYPPTKPAPRPIRWRAYILFPRHPCSKELICRSCKSSAREVHYPAVSCFLSIRVDVVMFVLDVRACCYIKADMHCYQSSMISDVRSTQAIKVKCGSIRTCPRMPCNFDANEYQAYRKRSPFSKFLFKTTIDQFFDVKVYVSIDGFITYDYFNFADFTIFFHIAICFPNNSVFERVSILASLVCRIFKMPSEYYSCSLPPSDMCL